MAEGNFCDYQNAMEIGFMQQLASYTEQNCQEQIENASRGPGFYIEQLPPGMPHTSMESLLMTEMGGMNGPPEPMGMTMSAQAVAAMYHNQQINFPMKPEIGMPPTPPGSPDDPKEIINGMGGMTHHFQHGSSSHMHPGSMPNMSSVHHHQHVLAKPVPMKGLRGKSRSQARACLGTVSSTVGSVSSAVGSVSSTVGSDPLMEQTLGEITAAQTSLARALAVIHKTQKRPRSVKKPIPPDQRDPRYFERRKRNNIAAKKSRDSRKAREDCIAVRAGLLERENAYLRFRIKALKDEASTLHNLLLEKRARQ